MTRYSDVNLTGKARAETAKNNKANVFVSIHLNGDTSASVQGTEVLLRSSPAPSQASRDLATDILASLVSAIRLRDRGIKQYARNDPAALNDLYHLTTTARCLVECSFLTDPAEEKRLLTAAYRDTIAGAIVAGIQNYLVTHP
jgi:N-acetylmuramoyl-L-alanine amidase